MDERGDVTAILGALGRGDRAAADRLMTIVYDELRALAGHFMGRERDDHTLQPTALANEAYLRLIDQRRTDWKNRAHFFAVAGELMRRILVDHARAKATLKRGAGAAAVPLDDRVLVTEQEVDLIALHEALEELGTLSDRQRQVVDMRFFGGLTVEETAHVLDVAPSTVKADWHLARAWLRRRLGC